MTGPYAPGWYDAQLPDVLDAEARRRFRTWRHAARISEYFTAARTAKP